MTSQVSIKEKIYNLHIGYQSENDLRQEFNRMTNQTWGFDFEQYYQSGFWEEDCIIYSLFDDNRIVAHTTLSIFEVTTEKRVMKLGQLGTVMTAPEYQHRGLARFLMERIQHDSQGYLQEVFLFANDSVLDFYPKFGFAPVEEFQATMPVALKRNSLAVQKMDLDDPGQRNLFRSYVENNTLQSKFDPRSLGLTFFYCYAYPEMGYKGSIYHVEALEAMVVAQEEGNILTLIQVFQRGNHSAEDIIQAIASPQINTVVFGFNPSSAGLQYTTYKEDDLTLFATPGLKTLLEENKLMIPLLAHT